MATFVQLNSERWVNLDRVTFIDDTGDGLILHLDTGNDVEVTGPDRLVILAALSPARYNEVSVIEPQPRSFGSELSSDSPSETPF